MASPPSPLSPDQERNAMGLGSPTERYYHPSQIPQLIRITWENGTSIESTSCEELEARVMEMQSFFYNFWDAAHFREVMAEQALQETGGFIELETDGDSRDFLQEMERGGFFNVAFFFAPPDPDAPKRAFRHVKINKSERYTEEVWPDAESDEQPKSSWDI